jgi:hypothetical protein
MPWRFYTVEGTAFFLLAKVKARFFCIDHCHSVGACMKFLSMIFALMFAFSLLAAEPAVKEGQAAMPLLELPVEVIGGKELDLGIMYSNELRNFQFTLKNTSNTALEYTRVIVNCSCSRLQIPVPGKIEPRTEFIVPVELDAQKISEKGTFKKTIRFDFPGYQSLLLTFTGRMSSDIKIFQSVDVKENPVKSIPVLFIESISQDWERVVHLKAEFADERQLDFGEPVFDDPSGHRGQLSKIADNHWTLTVCPLLPQKLGLIKNELRIPMLTPNAESNIRLVLEGMVGTHIEPSADEVFWDPLKDPPLTKKAISLTRLPFNDRALRVAALLGRPNPYTGKIKVLTSEEVKVPEVPGVEFELRQGSGGVYVVCHLQGNKMSADGSDAEFQVEGSQGCTVHFAIMDEKTRKVLQELEKEEE